MFRRYVAAALSMLLVACARNPAPLPVVPPTLDSPAAAAAGENVPPVVSSAITPGTLADFVENAGDRVFFAYDRSDLDDSAAVTLRRQAAWLARYPAVVLLIEGHADERGTRDYNLALGARRAATVRNYLVSLGVAAARLETVSYGKERPQCSESAEFCWQQNRRGVSTLRSSANF
jgi:peptidoglycan-associated lipoprotein